MPSLIQRAVAAIGRALPSGQRAAADWFGPEAPPTPQAPPDVAGRQFDYPVGYNLWQQPKTQEGRDFRALRALADGYDVLRLLIETRKDQMCGLAWSIKRRDPAAKGDDARLPVLEAFFRRPDGVNGWSTWLRMLLEDLLVIDAPTLYVQRTLAGQAIAFQVMDGATIKPVIDAFGRRPAPPATAYQQVLKGLAAVDYTADDLLYLPRNRRAHRVYGYSPVEQLEITVNIALRRQLFQLQYYTEGNIPEALIGVPDAWSPDQIKQFQSYWDLLHEGDGAARRHAKFVPGGVAKTFIPIKEPELKGAFDEWLARVACYCFSVSPQPFVAQMNRATAETAAEMAEDEGNQPTKRWVKELIDTLLAEEFASPDLEFAWAAPTVQDPAAQAATLDTYVRAGLMSPNEARALLGLDPVAGGDQPLIYTAAGVRPLAAALTVPLTVPLTV